MKKLFSLLVALTLSVAVQATETNLVFFLAKEMGKTPEEVGLSCASGGDANVQYHGQYTPPNAFDGVGESTDTMERWLGNMASAHTFLQFDIPPDLTEQYVFPLVSYEIWDSNAWTGDYLRGPVEWVLEGKTEKGEWIEIDRRNEVSWVDLPNKANEHKVFSVPVEKRGAYCAFRFTPLRSNTGGQWDVGLMELTLNVNVLKRDVLVVRSNLLEVDCFDPKAGEWMLDDFGPSVVCTSPEQYEQDGVHYELTGYALENKTTGGDWSAPVTNAGNQCSFTPAANQSVRLTWLWKIASYDITFETTRGGSISTSGGTYATNALVTVTATADHGFNFIRWSGSLPEAERAKSTLSFLATRPLSLKAVFQANYPIAGQQYVEFTVKGYQGKETLENLPVLVRLSPERISGFGEMDVGPAGQNIFFLDANGQSIPHEIERWDSNGESLVWVILPTVPSTGTSFRMMTGDSSPIPSDQGWADAGYAGVWHFSEPDGVVHDSTLNHLDATPMEKPATSIAVPGPVGSGRQNAVDDEGYLSLPDYDHLQLGDTFTFSGWVNMLPVGGARRCFSRKNAWNQESGWEIYIWGDNCQRFGIRGGDTTRVEGVFNESLDNKWGHMSLVYDGSLISVYNNGQLCAEGAIGPATDNGQTFSFGDNSTGGEANLHGSFDECRLYSKAISADRAKAEYEAMTNPGFLSNEGLQATGSGDVIAVTTTPYGYDFGIADPPFDTVIQNPVPNQRYEFKAPAAWTNEAGTTRAECTGWKLFHEDGTFTSGSGTTMAFDFTETAEVNWQYTIYQLVIVEADATMGSTDVTSLWAPVGDTVSVTATPNENVSFYKWTGDYQDNDPTSPTLSLKIGEAPISLTALFRPTCYVTVDGDDDNDGRTLKTPKATIQSAVAAYPVSTILVGPGTHVVTNIIAVSNAVAIVGQGEKTILSRQKGSAVNVLRISHPETVVRNLVVDGGREHGRSAVYIENGAMLDHCIVRNTKTWNLSCIGGGIYMEGEASHIRDCVVSNNHCQTSGGGGGSGGGLAMRNGFVENCRFIGNRVGEGSGGDGGGGVWIEDGVIRNCLIARNKVNVEGSGLFTKGGRVENCTIADNIAPASTTAAGVLNGGGTIVNCIIAGNSNKNGPNNHREQNSALPYSHTCTSPLAEGKGNLDANPQFVDPANGDYSIGAGMCVDSGLDMFWMEKAVDLAGRPRKLGAAVDMGCFEYESQALAVSLDVKPAIGLDYLDVTLTANVFGADLSGLVYTWDFGDGSEPVSGADKAMVVHRYGPGLFTPSLHVVNGAGNEADSTLKDSVKVKPLVAYVVTTNSTARYPYDSWKTAATNVSDAVAACGAGSKIVVSNGLYVAAKSIELTEAVKLVSVNGPEFTTLQVTGAWQNVVFEGDPRTFVSGFTIKGRDLSAVRIAHGGAISNCIVRDVRLIQNSVEGAGILVKGDGARVSDCSVFNNQLTCSGGWGAMGGGIHAEDAVTIENCVVTNNYLRWGQISRGAGISMKGNGGIIRNCLVADNECINDAGGIYAAGTALIENCTVVSNWTHRAAFTNNDGIVFPFASGITLDGSATARNLIVHGNYFQNDPCKREIQTLGEKCAFHSSDVFPLEEANGEGNFFANPRFKNPGQGDYRLRASSPCRGVGQNLDWMTDDATDLAGNRRVIGSKVDLGCYECTEDSSTLLLLR